GLRLWGLRDVTRQSLPLSSSAALSASATDIQLSQLADQELILSLISGNAEAMAHVFDRYYAIVRSIARKTLRNSEDVADAVQESFLDVYRNARGFDPARGTLKAWISCLAFHRCLKRVRTLKRQSRESGSEREALLILDASVRPEQWIGSLDFRKSLDKALMIVK